MLSMLPILLVHGAGSSSGDAEQQWQALARVVLAWAADPSALTSQQGGMPLRHPHPRLPHPSGGNEQPANLPTSQAWSPCPLLLHAMPGGLLQQCCWESGWA